MSEDRSEANNPTLFGQLLRGEIPSTRVWEDEHCIAFRDIHPAAPTHVLVIPRAYLPTVNAVREDDRWLMGHLIWVAQQVASAEGIGEDGYRLVINCNPAGGQTVYHLHLHVLGGRPLSWPPG